MTAVHIIGGEALHTTGRYFLKSAQAAGREAYYHTQPSRLPRLTSSDVLLFVEPFAAGWPPGLEDVPCPILAYLIDVHQGVHHRYPYLPFFDAVFVAQKDYRELVAQQCDAPVEWLPLACDPELAPTGLKRVFDVGFVGQLGPSGSSRRELLKSVLHTWNSNDYLRYHTPAEMAAVYASSQIVVNHSMNGDLNMRLFEAMSVGALVVTDRIQNGLNDLFVEGTHYVGYDTKDEAFDAIAYYLAHEEERRRIAEEAMTLVRERHTYDRRWAHIQDVSNGLVRPYRAAARHADPKERALTYAKVYESQRAPLAVLRLMARSEAIGAARLWPSFVRACARRLNYHVPVTSGARRARRERG